jgi:methionyl-tRNA formyltransferase
LPYRTLSRGCQHAIRRTYNVLFFGSDDFSIRSLAQIRESVPSIETLQVVTPPIHRSKQSTNTPPLYKYAKSLNMIVHQAPPKTLNDWNLPLTPDGLQHLKKGKAFDLAVVVSFGYFIPSRILSSLHHGAVNVHPSLLPKYT